MPRSEWASWAQAVGALVALAIAIGVPQVQRWSERRAVRRAAEHFAETLLMVAKASQELPEHGDMDYAQTAVIHLRHALDVGAALELGLLPRRSLVAIRGLTGIAKLMELNLSKLIEQPETLDEFPHAANHSVKVVERYAEQLLRG